MHLCDAPHFIVTLLDRSQNIVLLQKKSTVEDQKFIFPDESYIVFYFLPSLKGFYQQEFKWWLS